MFSLTIKHSLLICWLTNTTNLANLIDYLCLSYLVFSIGLFGLLFNYKNFLISMLSIEVMYLGVITGFAILSITTHNYFCQIYALVILILAASESAIGLGILIILFKFGRNVDFTTYEELKG